MAKKVVEEAVEAVETVVEAPVNNTEAQEDVSEGLIPEELIGADGKELLFPDGPTVEKVEEWKSLYNDSVYLTEFEEEVFIWRPITRKEYKAVMKIPNADSFYKEERICEAVVLYPEAYNFMSMTSGKAGIPTMLSELVMARSGFETKTGALKL